MSDDHWRNTYDQWKTSVPDEPPTCELCGGWLKRDAANFEWVCEWCDEHEEDLYPGEDIDGPT